MKTGRRRPDLACGLLDQWLAVLLLTACLIGGVQAQASPRKKPKEAASADAAGTVAFLGGTVFRDAGFALRGAEILVTRMPDETGSGDAAANGSSAAGKKGKPVNWKAVSDARGEFLLRLPAGPARYTISVRAAGCKPQEKAVAFTAGERLDQNFLLESVGNAK